MFHDLTRFSQPEYKIMQRNDVFKVLYPCLPFFFHSYTTYSAYALKAISFRYIYIQLQLAFDIQREGHFAAFSNTNRPSHKELGEDQPASLFDQILNNFIMP